MNSRRRRGASTAGLLALMIMLVLVASGCGGDSSKDAYEQGLRTVQEELAAANDASRESGETTDAAKRSELLNEAQAQIAKAATEAEKLSPPDDARTAHEKLAKALRAYADLFAKLADAKPDAPNQSELYTEAGTIVQELEDANRALDKAGYSASDTDADS